MLSSTPTYEGQGARRDRVVFEQLYGLDPAAVKCIGEYEYIS